MLKILKLMIYRSKKVREKSRECHNHKPQPFPDPKRKRKPTNLNKHKPNNRTKSTKISSLFPKRGNCNTKRTEKHKNKMTHGKTYNKSPRRINHKATKCKTNTGTTRSLKFETSGYKKDHPAKSKEKFVNTLEATCFKKSSSCSLLKMFVIMRLRSILTLSRFGIKLDHKDKSKKNLDNTLRDHFFEIIIINLTQNVCLNV